MLQISEHLLITNQLELRLTRRSIKLVSSPVANTSADNANPSTLTPHPAHLNPQRFSIYTKQRVSKESRKIMQVCRTLYIHIK
ncbi:hypothetical protein QL285_015509 [Trifolium repens]|nr:hypothetical protein QL285_015509 [Trifolium repens]